MMKKIAFVAPWFGENIPGGAEMELRGLTTHLNQAGVDIEILTTCVKDFASDWSENYYKAGNETVLGIPVRRFKVKKRNNQKFDAVNIKLMNNQEISREEEDVYCQEMVNSPELYDYIRENKDEYSLFVFIAYMFGTTYYGCKIWPEKSVLIPCFHDESYVYMSCFKEVYEKIGGMIFHASPEAKLANKIFNLSNVKNEVLGEGLDTEIISDAERFRKKYEVNEPFILYAGRKDIGKNVHTLIEYFAKYKERNAGDLKLVLIGGGSIDIPISIKNDVIDLGFVDLQDKYDACAAATLLCQPSNNESFSLVIMESWLCKRPVIVSGGCEVTKQFAIDTNGGLYFDNYFEFEGTVSYLLKNEEIANQMGENGCNYVKSNFAWDVIVDRYMKFFGDVVARYEKE